MKKSVVGLSLCAVLCWVSAHAQVTIIKAGHLIDPDAGTVARDRVVVVEGERITGVHDSVPQIEGATVIDLSRQWVLPGLMDLHAHLFANPTGWNTIGAYNLTASTSYRALIGLQNAQDMLRAGFTTVRDAGWAGSYADTDVRRILEEGRFIGPTLYHAGKIIAPFGGQEAGGASGKVPAELGPFWNEDYIDADGPEEMRKAVRKNIFYGANVIKLVSDNNRPGFTEAEVRMAAEEAHRAGLTLAVHCYSKEAAHAAILAGADSLEHGDEFSDETLKLMKAHGVFLVPTDQPKSFMRTHLADDEQIEAESAGPRDRLYRAHKLGVLLAFGTDAPNFNGMNRGQSTLAFADAWVEAGLPVAAILEALTTNGAKVLGIEKERGYIAAGQYADLIAVPANPLEDIGALKNVGFVMKNGRVVPGTASAPGAR
jgi:imidazolonepropionase-like amidohydrolase